ncbi:MAG: PASTA domain-containing protein [Pontiellaceae bacterium]|nr:PASTA domain-containing protein [Pontiellaceae bacterium]
MKKPNNIQTLKKIRLWFFLCLISGVSVFADAMTNVIYEGESAEEMIGVTVSTHESGFLGDSYADFGRAGSSLKWTRVFSGGGSATLSFRYANACGDKSFRPTELYVNNIKVSTIEWPLTELWTIWKTQEVQVTLRRGINTVELRQITYAGPNIDQMTVISSPAELKPVPDVTGLYREAAQANIISAGMVIGKVTTEYSTTVAAGMVIRQKPDGGSLQPDGCPIDLVISLGPPETLGNAERAFLALI